MPANLTPDYMAAEKEFRQAQTPHDRLTALKRMLSTIPKHKGTEKLQGDIKKKISKLNDEIQKSGKKKGFAISVPKEGAGQVVLVGPPNSGKSRLIAALTHASPVVAEYPFTTTAPFPAMMLYEDIPIQLVDLPPVSEQHTEFWVSGIIRNADIVLLVLDVGNNAVLEEFDSTLKLMDHYKLRLVSHDVTFDPWASVMDKKTFVVCNKIDLPDASDNMEVFLELYGTQFTFIPVSAERGDNLDELSRQVFLKLNVLRVYSKPPGKEVEKDKPYILKNGATVLDFANAVHHDFGDKLKFARIWGREKFDGQRVNKDHIMQDKDIVELHI